MLCAQILASIIYLASIALVMPYMVSLIATEISETSLIDAVAVTTVLLPPLLAMFQEQGVRRMVLVIGYLALAVLMALVVIFGKAVEA